MKGLAMFGRRLAVTTVKVDRDETSPSTIPTDFEKIGETVVNTAAGIGFVVVMTTAAITAARIAEHAAKYVLK